MRSRRPRWCGWRPAARPAPVEAGPSARAGRAACAAVPAERDGAASADARTMRWRRAPRQARPGKPSARGARDSPGSYDGVGLAQGLAAALDLDLDPARVAQLLVDLQRLVRAVHLVAVDAPDHVAVLHADLGVQGVRDDGEELEAVGHAVLERGHDPRLGGQVGEG